MPVEAKQALFTGDDSSRGLEQLVSGEHTASSSRSISVSASDGTVGSATLLCRTGAFSYMPYETPTRAQACASCCPPSSTDAQVSAADMLGASHDGADAFRIWYSPVISGSSKQVSRKIRKTATFQCQSVSEARALVTAVRAITAVAIGGNRPRNVHVVLNPVSGRSKAKGDYDRTVQPVLEAAGIQHTLHVTRAAGHAAVIAASLNLQQCDALLMMGGDGTVHEALQGFLGRPDWQLAAAVPFALLPAGSGNALAANTGMWNLDTAMHAVVKGQTAKLDVFSVLQPPHERRFAFLSVTFGLIANLDIGTEHLRFLGGMRFTLGALHQILWKRTHRLRLAYLPAQERYDTDSSMAHDGTAAASAATTAATVATTTTNVYGDNGFRESCSEGPSTPLLDRLPKDPTSWSEGSLPKGWKQLDDEQLQLFAVCNLPLLDMTYNLAPKAGLNTGCLDIISTTGNFSRMQGLDFMLKSETGDHLNLPQVRLVKADALLLEPVSDKTWLVVDGEQVPFERLALQVHPGLCRVLVAPGKPI